ncbi:MAG: hypothetical protein MR209_04380 [Veillonellaceae bacterium]|nr:hypothetical protein [Veillonellaceae bacterium]
MRDDKEKTGLGPFIVLGVLVGVVLGSFLGNMETGLTAGMCVGVGFGWVLSRHGDKDGDEE